MHIIYIHTHDSGQYLEPYGYKLNNPNLMELAHDGMVFRNCHCVSPTCSPSRAALLTGTYPHNNGMMGLAHMGYKLNNPNLHISHFLKIHGYNTVLCGFQHETANLSELGYKTILTDTEIMPENIREFDIANAEHAASFIHQYNDKSPMFLSYGTVSTHRPFPKQDEVGADYVIPPFPLPDTPEIRNDYADYIASAQFADKCVGIVLDALKSSDMYHDSMIIFTTDHGLAYPLMKCNLLDTGTKVALIIKKPGQETSALVSDALVSHMDIFPTICDIANLSKPDYLSGESLVTLLNGSKEPVHEEIYTEVTYHASYEPMRCIRTERYKYIRHFDSNTCIVPSNIDTCSVKDFVLNAGLVQYRKEPEMLFDLLLDPCERVNLAHSKCHNAIQQELSDKLMQFMHQTNDPLLNGRPNILGTIVLKRDSEPSDGILE